MRQLDNDIQSIYEVLTSISATQQRHSNRVDEIAAAQADATAERTAKAKSSTPSSNSYAGKHPTNDLRRPLPTAACRTIQQP